MKIIFFGTPDYVLPILISLHKNFNQKDSKNLVAVVTTPPKPTGRKKQIIHSPIDNWAYKHKISVYYNFNNLPPADLGVCASYGKIIPKNVIDKFKNGILNIHPSLLPKFRGASPVQAAILTNSNPTGVTVIKMDEEVDHGVIISSFSEEIKPEDTTETLRKRLFERSAQFLIDLIPNYLSNKINPKKQNHNKATFTKVIIRNDGFIPPKYLEPALKGESIKEDWKINFIKNYSIPPNAYSIERFIRAMWPWPEAWTLVKLFASEKQTAKRLKILKAHLENKKLILDEVQLEGKNPVTWKQFKEGYPKAKFEV